MSKHQYVIALGLGAITLVLGSFLVLPRNQEGQNPTLQGNLLEASSVKELAGGGDKVVTGHKTGDKSGDKVVTASLSPVLSPLSPSLSPLSLGVQPRPTISPTVSVYPQAFPESQPTLSPSPYASPLVTPSPVPTISLVPSSSPHALSPVVINEVGWMGTKASSADEWIELYNPNSAAVSLEGWMIKTARGGSPLEKLAGPFTGSIPAYGFYIIERIEDDNTLSIPADWKGPFGGAGLNNEGEDLVLVDNQSVAQDKVHGAEGWYAGDAVTKASMERKNYGSNDPGSWQTADTLSAIKDQEGNPIMGSPGSKNGGVQ